MISCRWCPRPGPVRARRMGGLVRINRCAGNRRSTGLATASCCCIHPEMKRHALRSALRCKGFGLYAAAKRCHQRFPACIKTSLSGLYWCAPMVMYAGAVVEHGPAARIFSQPSHSYTQALLRATPSVHSAQSTLVSIRGQIPLPWQLPNGCRFSDRCEFAYERCNAVPAAIEVAPRHAAACWRCESNS